MVTMSPQFSLTVILVVSTFVQGSSQLLVGDTGASQTRINGIHQNKRYGPHICRSAVYRPCCPGWQRSPSHGLCVTPVCSYGCGQGMCLGPNLCSCPGGQMAVHCPSSSWSSYQIIPNVHSEPQPERLHPQLPSSETLNESSSSSSSISSSNVMWRDLPDGDLKEYMSIHPSTYGHGKSQEFYEREKEILPSGASDIPPSLQSSDFEPRTQPDGSIPSFTSCQSAQCDHKCVFIGGQALCDCHPGYALEPDGITCTDVDECALFTGHCSQYCENTEGSYRCLCELGLKLASDGKTCFRNGEPPVWSKPSFIQPRSSNIAWLTGRNSYVNRLPYNTPYGQHYNPALSGTFYNSASSPTGQLRNSRTIIPDQYNHVSTENDFDSNLESFTENESTSRFSPLYPPYTSRLLPQLYRHNGYIRRLDNYPGQYPQIRPCNRCGYGPVPQPRFKQFRTPYTAKRHLIQLFLRSPGSSKAPKMRNSHKNKTVKFIKESTDDGGHFAELRSRKEDFLETSPLLKNESVFNQNFSLSASTRDPSKSFIRDIIIRLRLYRQRILKLQRLFRKQVTSDAKSDSVIPKYDASVERSVTVPFDAMFGDAPQQDEETTFKTGKKLYRCPEGQILVKTLDGSVECKENVEKDLGGMVFCPPGQRLFRTKNGFACLEAFIERGDSVDKKTTEVTVKPDTLTPSTPGGHGHAALGTVQTILTAAPELLPTTRVMPEHRASDHRNRAVTDRQSSTTSPRCPDHQTLITTVDGFVCLDKPDRPDDSTRVQCPDHQRLMNTHDGFICVDKTDRAKTPVQCPAGLTFVQTDTGPDCQYLPKTKDVPSCGPDQIIVYNEQGVRCHYANQPIKHLKPFPPKVICPNRQSVVQTSQGVECRDLGNNYPVECNVTGQVERARQVPPGDRNADVQCYYRTYKHPSTVAPIRGNRHSTNARSHENRRSSHRILHNQTRSHRVYPDTRRSKSDCGIGQESFRTQFGAICIRKPNGDPVYVTGKSCDATQIGMLTPTGPVCVLMSKEHVILKELEQHRHSSRTESASCQPGYRRIQQNGRQICEPIIHRPDQRNHPVTRGPEQTRCPPGYQVKEENGQRFCERQISTNRRPRPSRCPEGQRAVRADNRQGYECVDQRARAETSPQRNIPCPQGMILVRTLRGHVCAFIPDNLQPSRFQPLPYSPCSGNEYSPGCAPVNRGPQTEIQLPVPVKRTDVKSPNYPYPQGRGCAPGYYPAVIKARVVCLPLIDDRQCSKSRILGIIQSRPVCVAITGYPTQQIYHPSRPHRIAPPIDYSPNIEIPLQPSVPYRRIIAPVKPRCRIVPGQTANSQGPCLDIDNAEEIRDHYKSCKPGEKLVASPHGIICVLDQTTSTNTNPPSDLNHLIQNNPRQLTPPIQNNPRQLLPSIWNNRPQFHPSIRNNPRQSHPSIRNNPRQFNPSHNTHNYKFHNTNQRYRSGYQGYQRYRDEGATPPKCGPGERLRRTSAGLTCIRLSSVVCNPECSNGGQCVRGRCVCPRGLTGRDCKTDVNECKSLAQRGRACSYRCVNGFGHFKCTCPDGETLSPDGKTCRPLGCGDGCLNSGSCVDNKRCECKFGFEGHRCEKDINECAVRNGPCEYYCRNTKGSFACFCPPGRQLNEDKLTCQNQSCIPECQNGGRCINHRCTCPKGYKGFVCQIDKDECADRPCNQICTNSPGSYRCSCIRGFVLSNDRHTCVQQ